MLKLTPTPPANAFVTEQMLDFEQECFPLDIHQCLTCNHVQLLDVLAPEYLFEDYVYVSGTSPNFVKHFEDYAKSVISEFRILKGKFVVDIGSNDGTLLKFFQKDGMKVLGIDPAIEIAKSATESGIETITEFFSIELAKKIRDENEPATLILANNVFAHSDDLIGFTKGVNELLADDGIFVFEVSYLVDVYENTLFDTIYHEHLSYHTITPLKSFFERQGLELIDVIRIDTHGGSVRGIVQRSHGPRKVKNSVNELIELETELGLDKPKTLKDFSLKIDKLKNELHQLLGDLKQNGKTIVGYGAPAKATTLMYHLGLGSEILDFIVDDSPLKQGLYSPGMHIPVLPSTELYKTSPDYILILAWNFAEPIMKNHRALTDKGCKFIIPVPKIKIR